MALEWRCRKQPLTEGIMPGATTLIDKRIERLEKELHESRQAIIRLAPDNVLPILQSYYFCKTKEETDIWEENVIQKAIDVAIDRVNGDDESFFGQASCPLCRHSSTSPYQRGYLLPKGLQRHLSGRGHAHKCDVLTAALHLAREAWDDMFCEKTAKGE